MPLTISVIIRTKNEEKWIVRCLDAVFSQKVDAEIEVILVDNESTDGTINVAERFPISKVVTINDYLPGKALGAGIRESTGDYIVCLSAHCVPEKEDWLQKMLNNFKENTELAGVYGRQLPLSYTDPIDKRDLLTVFGLDKRIQIKDYFFHNANSMIPRSVWEEFPFDEKVTNIEDRVWGKKLIEAGYKIIYEPDAAVYHHHGLHHGNTSKRAKGVVSILEHLNTKNMNGIPQFMSPEKVNVAAVIPIVGNIVENSNQFKHFEKAVHDLKNSRFVKSIYCVAEDQSIVGSVGITWIDRKLIKEADSLGINELLQHTLELLECKGDFPECILYVNHDYLNRPQGIFDELIADSQHKGCDTVFPGLIDYGHYWYHDENDEYKQTDPSLKARTKRDPLYKALYGLGCLSAAWVIRQGNMVGGKVGILKVSDPESARRISKK